MNTHTHILLFFFLCLLQGQADLVGHWKLDEGSGTVASDRTANNRTGTIAGGPVWNTTDLPPVPSGTSAALEMDGFDDQVDIVGYKGIPGTGDRTISAWIRTAVDSTAQNMGIVSWGSNVGTQKWTFRVQDGNGTAGVIRIEANGGFLVGNTVVTDTNWHHVAVTWSNDGTPDILDARLYVDGVLDAEFGSLDTPPSASQSVAINTASGADVRIGDNFQATHNWEGGIDEVRIYDEALDAAAIARLALGDPIVSSFEASAEIVASGSAVDLTWTSDPENDSLSIDNGVGDVLGQNQVTVNPVADTTYTLTASQGADTVQLEVTVLVDQPPLIENFIILGASTIREGDSTTLFFDAFGEASLSINGSDVTGQEEIVLSPSETTTFVLSATNSFGTSTSEVTVTVLDGDAPDISWTAAELPEGSLSQWDPIINTTGNNGITFLNMTGGAVQSGVANFAGVGAWVNSPGYNLASNPLDSWQDGLGDQITKADVSWELVFRPRDFLETHVLFNTGGNGDGTAFVLTDSVLDFRVQTANSDAERILVSVDLTDFGGSDDFYHVVATVDTDAVNPGTANLYLNGELVASASSSSPLDDWDGGDLAELGKGSNIPTSTAFPSAPFNGDIAAFNYYGGRILSLAQVTSKYNAISGSGGGLAITGIAYDEEAAEIRLTFNSVPGRFYALETTDDLAAPNWTEINDSIPADGPETTVVLSGLSFPDPGDKRRFYRIRPGVN